MRDGRTTTSEDRATQLLICEALSLAIIQVVKLTSFCDSLFLKFICTFPGAQILGLVPECFLCTTVALSEIMFWLLSQITLNIRANLYHHK